jgi:hypothetical protein
MIIILSDMVCFVFAGTLPDIFLFITPAAMPPKKQLQHLKNARSSKAKAQAEAQKVQEDANAVPEALAPEDLPPEEGIAGPAAGTPPAENVGAEVALGLHSGPEGSTIGADSDTTDVDSDDPDYRLENMRLAMDTPRPPPAQAEVEAGPSNLETVASLEGVEDAPLLIHSMELY